MGKIKKLIKDNPITFVILIPAVITCIMVPPDKEYLGYFDLKTLSSLYCILVVVECLKDSYFFNTYQKE